MRNWLLKQLAKKDQQLALWLKQRGCTHKWEQTAYMDSSNGAPYKALAKTGTCEHCSYKLIVDEWKQLPKTGIV